MSAHKNERHRMCDSKQTLCVRTEKGCLIIIHDGLDTRIPAHIDQPIHCRRCARSFGNAREFRDRLFLLGEVVGVSRLSGFEYLWFSGGPYFLWHFEGLALEISEDFRPVKAVSLRLFEDFFTLCCLKRDGFCKSADIEG